MEQFREVELDLGESELDRFYISYTFIVSF